MMRAVLSGGYQRSIHPLVIMMNAVQAGAPRPVVGQHMFPFVKQYVVTMVAWVKKRPIFDHFYSKDQLVLRWKERWGKMTRQEQVELVEKNAGHRPERIVDIMPRYLVDHL